MSNLAIESPLEEQDICINCGLCCDGTLFNHAVLQSGEKGGLPEKIEQNYGSEDGNEYFTLPCPYFCGKCTIYDQKKAVVCSAFRCKLLKNFSEKKITLTIAKSTVDTFLKYRSEIYQLYYFIFGNEYAQNFRKLIVELPKLINEANRDSYKQDELDALMHKCIIYDILLTKTFKSTKQFESLLEVPNE